MDTTDLYPAKKDHFSHKKFVTLYSAIL